MVQAEAKKILNHAIPALLAWYETHRRPLPWRTERSAYHTWISEIMLQQTRIEAVIDYYHRFLDRFPDVRSLASADDDTLLKMWEGLGYYNRARNIKKAAVIVTERYGGELPRTKDAWQALPGIGDYTAAAIASMVFNEPVAAVDGNVLRVIARLLDDKRDVLLAHTKTEVTSLLNEVIPAGSPGAFNEGLMELGETVCLPVEEPDCSVCPLHPHCLARAHGTVSERPVRINKTAKKSEKMTVFVMLTADGRAAIRQRPAGGLLPGLYEFPHVPGHLDTDQAHAYLTENGYAIASIEPLTGHTHVFTHKKWLMKGYLVRLRPEAEKKDESLRFVPVNELYSTYPIPTAFASFRKAIS